MKVFGPLVLPLLLIFSLILITYVACGGTPGANPQPQQAQTTPLSPSPTAPPAPPDPAPLPAPPPPAPPAPPPPAGALPDICACTASEPPDEQYRFAAKHASLPDVPGEEITVGMMIDWPLGKKPAFNAPRTGRELTVFHVAHAYLHAAVPNRVDCDIHFEISDSPDEHAPRVIMEITINKEFCPARRALQAQLAQLGFRLTMRGGLGFEPAIPVEARGLAFRDRTPGSPRAATPWELHPVVLKVLPQ